jgi:hypothetical protein
MNMYSLTFWDSKGRQLPIDNRIMNRFDSEVEVMTAVRQMLDSAVRNGAVTVSIHNCLRWSYDEYKIIGGDLIRI